MNIVGYRSPFKKISSVKSSPMKFEPLTMMAIAAAPGLIQAAGSLFGMSKRKKEQRAAQEANIASGGGRFQGGMGFSGFGARGASGQRRSVMDTLNQRRASIAESEASKYGQLLNSIASQLTSGFGSNLRRARRSWPSARLWTPWPRRSGRRTIWSSCARRRRCATRRPGSRSSSRSGRRRARRRRSES